MAKVQVYGASDDLIEIRGAIYEEFNPGYDDGISYLGFSDGTVLSVQYGQDGIWRINRMMEGIATYEKTEGRTEPDEGTDTVTLTGDIRWVVFGTKIEKAVAKERWN
jgi:hypothetical protein